MIRTSWYNRLLLSYLPVFLAISVSLSTIAFLVISEISKKATLSSNEVLTRNIMQHLDNSLSNVESVLQSAINKNKVLTEFFTQTDTTSHTEQLHAALELIQLMANTPLIDSIYLYRPMDDAIVTPTTTTQLPSFGDADYLRKAKTSLDPFVWEGPRMYRECTDGCENRNVVSLVRAAYLSSKVLMVVNVRTTSLQQLVLQMTALDPSRIQLTDAIGRPILTDAVMGSGTYHPLDTGGKLTSSYTGWTLYSNIYPNQLFYFVSNLFYFWVVLAVAVIIIGIVWIVHISRRQYQPVETILKEIGREFPRVQEDQPDSTRDDFMYIQSTLRHLVASSQQLQTENKENYVFRKQFLFQELMNGHYSLYHNNTRVELERLRLNEDNVGFLVVLIEIDDYGQFEDTFPPRDQELFKLALKSVVVDIADQNHTPVWVEWLDRHRLGVLYPSFAGTVELQTEQLCEKIRSWVEQQLKFTVTIGIGSTVYQVEQIAESYLSACKSVNYKASLGNNRIIEFTELNHPEGEMFRQLNRVRLVAQLFRQGNSEWESHSREVYEELRKQLFSKDDLHNLFHYLIYHLHKETTELAPNLQEIWTQHAYPGLHDVIRTVDTLEDMYPRFEEILKEASSRMQAIRQDDNHFQFIQKVKRYIEEHYADPDLSLTQISAAFELSPSYLSRLFKEELGEKFIDYVTQVRIDRSVRLLKQTSDSIQDIAGKVGYVNSVTFIRVFKKVMGDTPGNYRKK